jgi:hypothetical protein
MAGVCRHCGGHDDVHHGVCAQCRDLGHEEARSTPRRDPDVGALHDRPWIARSAFTGRKRRSPRM